jgi:hypothetical protein
MPRITTLRVAALLLLGITGYGAAATRDQTVAALTDGAQKAQSLCYRLVHDDTFEFGDCVRALVMQHRQPSATRLGIEYFGWIGAMNSARLGMAGAGETAAEFRGRFRATQKTLGIDDPTLCASIPGDCAARMARIRQAERSSEPQSRAR